MVPRLSRPHKGKYFSDGCARLWACMRRKKLTQTGLAKLLGTTSGQVNQWLYGHRGMSLEWAIKMRDQLRIPVDAWCAAADDFELPDAA